ncbi:hypothetical protein [Pararhizobium sp. O133]|uniref:hypothetical protein n=1 Tax=Pararhizobium sp. O133 TaxID=3449278 RepID=UPI003F6832D7
MDEIKHQGTVAMTRTYPISRELLGKIIDDVFGGAIEDASVIEDIYSAIKNFEATPPPVHLVRGLIEKIAATPIWQDTYPDGPDASDGRYRITPDDIRACRAVLAASEGSTDA